MIGRIIERIAGKVPKGKRRHKDWRKVRKIHLDVNHCCELCFGTKKLEVHHIVPFHIAPDLELDPTNLVTLCQSKRFGINCHLLIGHGGIWQGINPHCKDDISKMRNIIGYSRSIAAWGKK